MRATNNDGVKNTRGRGDGTRARVVFHFLCVALRDNMAAYNITRAVTELLDEHKDSLPSFTIQLYPEHWTLNGGPKFLYNNQVAVRGRSLFRAKVR